MILQTDRLYLRRMTQADFPSLCAILQDEQTMYAYEGAFTDAEVQEWLDRQITRTAFRVNSSGSPGPMLIP